MLTTQIILTIRHSKEIPDLLDKVAGRAYSMDGVEDVTAALPSTKAERPFANLSVDRSGLHELWLMTKDDEGLMRPIAGPVQWPGGWQKAYEAAAENRRGQ